MKVLYINRRYPPDGGNAAAGVLASIVDGFRERGHEASVLTTHAGQGVVVETVAQTPVYRLGAKNLCWHFPAAARSARSNGAWHALDSWRLSMSRAVGLRLDADRPQLIVCHDAKGLSAAVWSQARHRGIPVVQVLHDFDALCLKGQMYRGGRCCARPCIGCSVSRLPHRRAASAVSAVVGISRGVLDTHLHHGLFAEARIKTFVHNARLLAAPRTRSRDAAQPMTLGFIGELVEVRGIELLLESFTRVARRLGRPMQLLVAGRGRPEYEAHLRRRYASGRIRFVGEVEAAEFFEVIDFSVVPSLWHEPFSTEALESLGRGVPVVGARRGGTAEMVHEPINGLLFEPSDPGSLDTALTRMIVDTEMLKRMRRLARGSVSPLLDPGRVLDEYEAIYRLVLAGQTAALPRAGKPLPAGPAGAAAPLLPSAIAPALSPGVSRTVAPGIGGVRAVRVAH